MPASETYRVFVSHSWNYDDYDRLVDLLDAADGLSWEDLSIPRDDPVHAEGEDALLAAFAEQIGAADIVLAISAVSATYSDPIQAELDIARDQDKPIIGIRPWGNQRESAIVQNYADELVSWNTDSIVDAIERWAEER